MLKRLPWPVRLLLFIVGALSWVQSAIGLPAWLKTVADGVGSDGLVRVVLLLLGLAVVLLAIGPERLGQWVALLPSQKPAPQPAEVPRREPVAQRPPRKAIAIPASPSVAVDSQALAERLAELLYEGQARRGNLNMDLAGDIGAAFGGSVGPRVKREQAARDWEARVDTAVKDDPRLLCEWQAVPGLPIIGHSTIGLTKPTVTRTHVLKFYNDKLNALERMIIGLGSGSDAMVQASGPPKHATDQSHPGVRATTAALVPSDAVAGLQDIVNELGTIRLRLDAARRSGTYPWNFHLPASEYHEHKHLLSGEARELAGEAYVQFDHLNELINARSEDGSPVADSDDLPVLLSLTDRTKAAISDHIRRVGPA